MAVMDFAEQIDKDDPLPRHAQVQRILREMVGDGRLKPGDKIPAESVLADALGVSKMTVNKALLVLTADGLFAREVGRGTFVTERVPRNAAKDVALQVSSAASRIVLSFPHGARNILDSDYYSSIYRGVADVVEASVGAGAVEIMLSPLAAVDYVAEEARMPAQGRIIIAPREESIPSLEELWESGHTLVVVGASWGAMKVPSIDSDNVGGAMEAVLHLIGLGHRRIGLLLAEPETANTQDRIQGYRRALTAARIPWKPEWEVSAEEVWRTGEASSAQLKELVTRSHEPVTAIFAAGHYLALEAMNIVRDAGKRVPEDVSVIGFDDPISARLAYPALTSVRQPLPEMGRRAAERLLNMRSGTEKRVASREMLPTDLIPRASTSAANLDLKR